MRAADALPHRPLRGGRASDSPRVPVLREPILPFDYSFRNQFLVA